MTPPAMLTTVVGEGNVSFYYKLASASEDELTFTIDDTPQITWTSGTTWNHTGNFTISDSAQHVLKWKYSKTRSSEGAGLRRPQSHVCVKTPWRGCGSLKSGRTWGWFKAKRPFCNRLPVKAAIPEAPLRSALRLKI